MRLTIALFLLAALLFLAAACTTTAETTAAITAVGASASAFVKALSPMLAPEIQAKLMALATSIDGTAGATVAAVGTIADTIVQLKSNVGSQFAQHAECLAKTANEVAALPSRSEVYLASGGTGVAGTATSRLLSHMKHSKPKT